MTTEKDIHKYTTDRPTITSELLSCTASAYLVRLVAEVTAEGLGSSVCGLVFVQQGGAGEHLVAGWTLVELFRVELLDVLAMLLQCGEAETTLLTVVRLRQI